MTYYLTLLGVLFFYMTFWFIVSLIKKRNDVADIAWGIGFVFLAWSSFFIVGEGGSRALLVNLLVTIWGIRLASHIWMRNKNKAEDYRYKKWREEWGRWFYLRSYFQVYIFQGIMLFAIISPVLIINKYGGDNLNLLHFIGVFIWITGFFFEVVGDAQLNNFIKDSKNKGELMQEGLWKYTRHPNYFGEVILWWGLWLIALSAPNSFFTIIGPLTITVLILKVSGIPMLEKKMSKHPDFKKYKKRVSPFFPLPPKKEN